MDSYKDVKNYIHNELGITKEYIDDIIRKTVKEEIVKVLNDNERIRRTVENEVVRCCKIYNSDGTRRSFVINVMDDIYNKIDKVIHEEVHKRLIIELKEPEECTRQENI